MRFAIAPYARTRQIAPMPRIVCAALALTLILALAPPALAATAHKKHTHKRVVHKKRHVSRHWHGYGFLPGYVPPEVAQRERERRYREEGPHYYGPAWPGFYRGRWNGGGFGPCYTYTPIGYMWNCGK
jgi:hypothetical protein